MDFTDWMIKGLVGGIALYAVKILTEMKKSLDSVNNKMAAMVERSEWHSKEIERIEKRVNRVEVRKS